MGKWSKCAVSRRSVPWGLVLVILSVFLTSGGGCHKHRASVTAVPLSPWNQCEPEGIPYYLPKPLLVVAKNVRHIDESKVGLTAPAPIPNGFDNQASYADVKANVTVPGSTTSAAGAAGNAAVASAFDTNQTALPDIWEKMTPQDRIQDGVAPDSFYTYQIVFVPDLSQKYGLRIKGGPGEMRAAMNLVNGWMYTGMGPFYLKDSSTAQNMMAFGVASMFAGRGAADVLGEVGDLAKIAGGGQSERSAVDAADVLGAYNKLARILQSQTLIPQQMLNYAQISIYEAQMLPDGTTDWTPIAQHSFDRHYFQPSLSQGGVELFKMILEAEKTQSKGPASNPGGQLNLNTDKASGTSERAPVGPSVGDRAPVLNSPAGITAEPVDVAPAPVINADDQTLNQLERTMFGLPLMSPQKSPAASQVNVNVNTDERPRRPRLWRGFGFFHRKERPKIERRVHVYQEQGPPSAVVSGLSSVGSGTQNPAVLSGSGLVGSIDNQ